MESRAEGLLDTSFGHFPDNTPLLVRESTDMGEAGSEDDLRWRRLGIFLCFSSGVTTLLLFTTAYKFLFG